MIFDSFTQISRETSINLSMCLTFKNVDVEHAYNNKPSVAKAMEDILLYLRNT